MPSRPRKHDRLPFTKDRSKQNKISFKFLCFHLNHVLFFPIPAIAQKPHHIPNWFLVFKSMRTLVKAKDAKASQTPGTKAPAKQVEGNSALAQMLHVSVCLCSVICTVETDSLEGKGGQFEGVKLKLSPC